MAQHMAAEPIRDVLGDSAVRSVAMADGFDVSTTTVDGRGRAYLSCRCCSWYAYHISTSVGGAVAGKFVTADLAELNRSASELACPPEVQAAVAAARAARAGAQAQIG